MFFKIINPESLKIEHSYESEEAVQYGGPWGSYPHIAVPEGMDPDCVKAISSKETISVEETPAVPAQTHLDEETGDIVIDVAGTPATFKDVEVTRYGLELDHDLMKSKRLRRKEQRKEQKVRDTLERMNTDLKEAFGVESPTLAVLDMLALMDMVLVPADYVDAADPDLDTNAKVQAEAKQELKQHRKALKKWLKSKKTLKDDLASEG